MKRAAQALDALERIARRYGGDYSARKRDLLGALARHRLTSARQVRALHEVLCLLSAYPDDARVHAQVRRLLRAFGRRADLRRHRAALAGTGIAGTDTPFRFFWPTARWISTTWPGALVLDRRDRIMARDLDGALPQLLDRATIGWLSSVPVSGLDAIDRLCPEGVTDADYLIGLVLRMAGDEFSREAWFDRLDPSFVLRAGPGLPERSTAFFSGAPLHHRRTDFRSARPSLREQAQRAPRALRRLSARATLELVRLARAAMISRARDLEVFEYPDGAGALLVDDGEGLAFALLGLACERRALLPATFGGLILQCGVPVGYVQLDLLGRHGALSFNQFESFRGSEAARLFARLVALTHHLFGCDEFSIEPYQLGHGNEEGIESGAWWFYRRLGFAPHDRTARRLAAQERNRRRRNPRYRSSKAVLRRLARSHLYFALDPAHRPRLPLIESWIAASQHILRRYAHADPRERTDRATRDALRRLAASRQPRLSPASRAWLRRWAGLLLAWTARGRWTRNARRALLAIAISKAGRSERPFLRALLRHAPLRRLLRC